MMMQLYKRRTDKTLEKQYDLQRSRYENMSTGGTGGKAGKASYVKSSSHETSIRELHHSTWADDDFKEFLEELDKAISQYHSDAGISSESDNSISSDKPDIESITSAVFDLLSPLDHNDIVHILNDIAEKLDVFEPDTSDD